MNLTWPWLYRFKHGGSKVTATELQSIVDRANDLYGAVTPTGGVMAFAGSSAPSGWLLCQGQAVSRTTYSALFSVIGSTYGAGNGSTTFNVPGMRTRVVVGADGGTFPLAGLGGSQSHTHAFDDGGHTHSTSVALSKSTVTAQSGSGTGSLLLSSTSVDNTSPTGSTHAGGTTGGVSDLPVPWIALNYVIKT